MISNGLVYLCIMMSLLSAVPVEAQNTPPVETPASADSSAETSDLFYLCKRDKLTRWLRAYKLESGKCNTLYSKEGYLQVISSATYFTSCEGVLHSVQKNLEEGGFKCTRASADPVIELD